MALDLQLSAKYDGVAAVEYWLIGLQLGALGTGDLTDKFKAESDELLLCTGGIFCSHSSTKRCCCSLGFTETTTELAGKFKLFSRGDSTTGLDLVVFTSTVRSLFCKMVATIAFFSSFFLLTSLLLLLTVMPSEARTMSVNCSRVMVLLLSEPVSSSMDLDSDFFLFLLLLMAGPLDESMRSCLFFAVALRNFRRFIVVPGLLSESAPINLGENWIKNRILIWEKHVLLANHVLFCVTSFSTTSCFQTPRNLMDCFAIMP